MNKELTKEEAEEYYNKLWLENKELIQENIGKIHSKCCALEMLLIDKDKEIERLNNIINKLERRFNQELENNEKWDIEDTKQFYSKKWYKDTLNDFKNMIKN